MGIQRILDHSIIPIHKRFQNLNVQNDLLQSKFNVIMYLKIYVFSKFRLD